MNKTYRLIWSSIKEAWLVVAETVKANGGLSSLTVGAATATVSFFLSSTPASALDPSALPTGGRIIAGSGSITANGNAMNITQNTQRMIANWSTFNIGQNASVAFKQPNASAIALNRIQDQNPSQIFGSLAANGQVWLVNPSGIMFGRNVQVNVGGLVASSLNITNDNFLVGKNIFEKLGTAGAITNQGTISAAYGGYIALISPAVSNEGSLTANGGTVAMAAGDKVNLDFNGDSLISFTVEQGAVDAMAHNSGLVKADGGLVMMTAKAAHDLTSAVVNNTGIIEAQTLENKAGRILLLADMKSGETIVGGRLDASAPNGGDGGFIETSAAKVSVKNDVQITTKAPKGKTGEWLIDPVDITIAAFGGDVSGATIATALLSSDVTLDTTGTGACTGVACGALGAGSGDITINDNINTTGDLGAARTLKLIAERDIILKGTKKIDATLGGNTRALNVVFNADSNADSSGGVTLEYSSAIKSNGGNIVMGGGTCTTAGCSAPAYGTGAAGTGGITTDINDWGAITMSSNGGNIWMSGVAPAGGGAGIHLQNVTINSGTAGSVYLKGTGVYDAANPQDGNGYGLFIKHSTIIGGSGGMTLDGTAAAGGGFGPSPAAIGLTGTASAYTTDGGTLTVNATDGTYINCNWTDDLLGGASQNGKIVLNFTGTTIPTLPNITKPSGDLEINSSGSISIGALDGGAGAISISTGSGDLEITGAITTTSNSNNAVILNAGKDAAAGTSTGGNIFINGGSITTGGTGRATLYSGSVAGSNGLTALIGSGTGNFRYNSDESATNYSAALAAGTYAIYREQPTVTTTANDDSKTYNGVAYSGGNGVTYSGFVNGDTSAALGGTLTYGGTSQGAINANTYTIVPSGYTNGLGYALAYANGTLTINGAPLTTSITGNLTGAVTKVYDGTNTATLTSANYLLTGWVGADGATVTKTTGTYNTAAAGTNKTVTVSLVNGDYAPTGATNLANYSLPTTITGAVGTISKAPLTVTANNDSTTYNGSAYSGGKGVTYNGFVHNETATVLDGTLSYTGTSQGAINVGTYTITPQGLSSGNYLITFSNGSLTINPAPLTLLSVAAQNGSKTYGTTYSFTGQEFVSTGLAGGETIGSVTLTSAGSPATAEVGNYAIIPSNATGGTFRPANYTITYVNGTLTVTPAPLTITANNFSKAYNGVAYTGGNGVTYNGFVNGETQSALGGALTYGGTSQGATNAGSYVITPQGLTSSNYQISYTNGTLTVSPAPLSVTANNDSKTYNGVAYTGGNGVTYNGFVHGETQLTLGGTLTYGGTSQGATNAGSYVITPQGLASSNYQISYTNGTLTVSPAPLLVTANNDSKRSNGVAYTGGNGVTYNGFVHGEAQSVLGGALTYGGTSQGATSAGTYAITPQGLASSNYSITFLNGTLTIEPPVPATSAPTVDSVTTAVTSTITTVPTPPTGGNQTTGVTVTAPVSVVNTSGGATVPGGLGSSTIAGGSSLDLLGLTAGGGTGGTGVIVLSGGSSSLGYSGNSTIVAGSGSDTLLGGSGRDLLIGGAGFGGGISGGTLTAAGANSFQVALTSRSPGGGDALVVNSRLPDQTVSSGARISVTIPSDAFAHTRADASVTLSATRADGAALPGWLSFNPRTGTFEGTPPPGFRGEVAVKLTARDSEGRQVVQTFKIVVGQGQGQPGQRQG
jgi:filamentous hemagglutinin family protein